LYQSTAFSRAATVNKRLGLQPLPVRFLQGLKPSLFLHLVSARL
jgi:hypothetical protein